LKIYLKFLLLEFLKISIRVTKILLETSSVEYWAVDEAFVGNCKPTDMMFINQRLADLEMLAVPAVFETGNFCKLAFKKFKCAVFYLCNFT